MPIKGAVNTERLGGRWPAAGGEAAAFARLLRAKLERKTRCPPRCARRAAALVLRGIDYYLFSRAMCVHLRSIQR